MVPGQHPVRMNMYITRSENGTFKVVENLGHTDPAECEVPLLTGPDRPRSTPGGRGAGAGVAMPE